jgi:hypothetical protein
MNPEQEQAILELRQKKLTPKQIARQLGLKVAEVTRFIKARGEETAIDLAAKGELAPITECLINTNSAKRLLEKAEIEDGVGGLAAVIITRNIGHNRLLSCSYLVDYWCLGVKDVMGPAKMNEIKYKNFINRIYSPFADGYQEISLEEAQAIVLGAVDYAAKLGLRPHADFNQKAKAHLGEYKGSIKLEFGHEGKPFFISGPYDNVSKILNTLRQTVGEDNFDFLAEIE